MEYLSSIGLYKINKAIITNLAYWFTNAQTSFWINWNADLLKNRRITEGITMESQGCYIYTYIPYMYVPHYTILSQSAMCLRATDLNADDTTHTCSCLHTDQVNTHGLCVCACVFLGADYAGLVDQVVCKRSDLGEEKNSEWACTKIQNNNKPDRATDV